MRAPLPLTREHLQGGEPQDRSITGVSRTTLYSFMSTRGLKPSP